LTVESSSARVSVPPDGLVAGYGRDVCLACRRPAGVCYCRFVTTFATRTRVVVLQHPRERDMPVNTARIASLCLPDAEVHVGLRLTNPRLLNDPRRPAALLYPGPGAVDVELHPPATDITLVVVDGTWSQAKKLVRLNPELAALPRYAFRPPNPSEYRIRREPREDYVSTLEALIHVLGVLEGDRDRFLPMLRPFRAMVDAQIAFATSSQSRRRTKHPRTRAPADPRARLPAALRDRPRDLLCVHAEANAWPYGSDERATCPEELVHWVATRPATGESFEAIVAPRHSLCAKTPWHLGIQDAELLRGMTPAALHASWARFARPTDVVCAWGSHTVALFEAVSGTLPPARVDLRHAARSYSNVAVGTMDDFRESLGLERPPPCAAGRAGERLATLSAIASFLAS
jgi:DTW domain-containing protein YfiP